jgi:ubiquinone/menaquinone biosynthesis C-methylase UbiE
MIAGHATNVITSTESLNIRLAANRRYSTIDFQAWLMRHLDVRDGMDVLDVGCGNGAQALELLRRVGAKGSVSALDIATTSVESLRAQSAGAENLRAAVADMMELAGVVASTFRGKRYDLAQSTYALYYAADPVRVLDAMRAVLKPAGRLATCVPNNPHGLHEFLKRFIAVPAAADAVGRFGAEVLEPYFRRHFAEVSVHLLCNVQKIPLASEVMRFWGNTSYYDVAADGIVRAAIEREIGEHGHFAFQKNSFLIVGQSPFDQD